MAKKKTSSGVELTPIIYKGREYITVAQRIAEVNASSMVPRFQMLRSEPMEFQGLPLWRVEIEIEGRRFQGTASVNIGGRGADATNPVENAETSALGRALGLAGFGSLESVASAEEVISAVSREQSGDLAQDRYQRASSPAPQQRQPAPAPASPAPAQQPAAQAQAAEPAPAAESDYEQQKKAVHAIIKLWLHMWPHAAQVKGLTQACEFFVGGADIDNGMAVALSAAGMDKLKRFFDELKRLRAEHKELLADAETDKTRDLRQLLADQNKAFFDKVGYAFQPEPAPKAKPEPVKPAPLEGGPAPAAEPEEETVLDMMIDTFLDLDGLTERLYGPALDETGLAKIHEKVYTSCLRLTKPGVPELNAIIANNSQDVLKERLKKSGNSFTQGQYAQFVRSVCLQLGEHIKVVKAATEDGPPPF